MIPLIIFVAILPLLPITRPKAEEGSGISNGAEGRPADHTLIPARTLLASSSAPRDHDAASDEPSAGGTASPLRPTTTTVSASNTTSTSTAACSAAPTSIVTSGRDGALNIERPREGPRDSNDAERPREGPRDSNDAEIPSRKGPRELANLKGPSSLRNEEEGLGASNEAEGPQGDISLLASSSATHDQDSEPALTSASDEPSAGGTITTTDVSRPAAPSTRSNEAFNIEIPSEGTRDRNDDNQGPFKLAKTFLGLTFQAAVALMIYRVQPHQGDSSTNLSPQGDSSANRSSLSAIQFNMVGATTLFSFASTMSGMMLKNQNRKAANFCSYAGVFLGTLSFFLMLSIVAYESLDWLVGAVGGFLLLVFAYTIRLEMGI